MSQLPKISPLICIFQLDILRILVFGNFFLFLNVFSYLSLVRLHISSTLEHGLKLYVSINDLSHDERDVDLTLVEV